ncbi:MAG TPA: MATE family efflux transporter [Acidimicrobiia bacterium]|nr:MATE family efflux transporter [Acidimicrobiia bacterium]
MRDRSGRRSEADRDPARPLGRPIFARRSPHDREIVRLALPAFGALVAEPLYVLADTAIVGRLGTRPLAGLAVAGIVLSSAFSVFNFLAYSTTAGVARYLGSGDRRRAAELGVDGMWLALAIGVALTVVGAALSSVIVDAMGASARVHPYALTYLRISLLGAPLLLVTFAGTGYLRGLQDTRTTLMIAVAANVLNLALEVLFVFGFSWGISGSAWGTVLAQLISAIAFAIVVARRAQAAGASLSPRRAGIRAVAVVGGPLIVRTGSLLAVFLVATDLAARMGDRQVAAHEIAFQTFLFLALSLDALAIAGQAMIGRFLGASDAEQARAAARRMLEWGVVAGVGFGVILALARTWFVAVFTDVAEVRTLAEQLLLIVAVLQPLNAVIFVLDGVLIGAGDQRYLAEAMMVATFAVFAPAAALTAGLDAGIFVLWGALASWFVARAVGVAWRYAGDAWQVTGATRT